MHNFYFRRQFLIARQPIEEVFSWQMLELSQYYLYIHPDLQVTVAEDLSIKLIMLGYLFDPENYTASNKQILTKILTACENFNSLKIILKPYAGRYVLLYQDSNSLNIIQDALSLREVYYCTSANRVICGSQPNLLVRFSQPELKISSDPKLLDFVQNHFPRVRNGRLWPGDGTQFEGVRHLLPNHYLDLYNVKSHRYWPNAPLCKMELNEAVPKCAQFLQGVMKAALYRHPLMMAVTAGLDSRALLAASRDISDSIYFFINKEDRLNDKSSDIKIPKEIFKRIDLPFHIHEILKEVHPEFKKIFVNNVLLAHEMSLPVIYNIYHKHHSHRVNILGVGELGRTKFYDEPKELTPYYLAYMLRHRKSSYAVRECEKWLNDSLPIAQKYGLNAMTLFWWEVLIGNWGSVGNSESDIAIEEFDPYASHLLYEMFLSVDKKYRTFKDNVLFDELIKFMWPELLEVPVNPPDSVKDWYVIALQKMKLEFPARMLKARFYEIYYKLVWKNRQLKV